MSEAEQESKTDYSQLIYEEVLKHGSVWYGAVDLLVERCRGKDQILRAGAETPTKASCKYIKGEPLSEKETSAIYEHGLSVYRARALGELIRDGIINDQANRAFSMRANGGKPHEGLEDAGMNPEKICDYVIHPAASVFPLLEGERFQSLVDSIFVHGVQNPIVSHKGEVLDGRNRLRAVMKLREEGHTVDLPCVEWDAKCGMSATEWVAAQNLDRRHLSADAYVTATAAINRILHREALERQKASQFTQGKSGNPSGKKQVTTKPSLPAQRDRKLDDARSTVGQVAAKAGVSMHKARQAAKLDKAVADGVIPQEVQKEVIAGKKKLRDAVKEIPAKTKPVKQRHQAPAKPPATARADGDIEPNQMLDDISYFALAFLDACPERADELEGLLLTWVSRCKQR